MTIPQIMNAFEDITDEYLRTVEIRWIRRTASPDFGPVASQISVGLG